MGGGGGGGGGAMVKPVTAKQRELFSVNMIIPAESGCHVTCSCLQSEGAIDLLHVYCTTAVEYC